MPSQRSKKYLNSALQAVFITVESKFLKNVLWFVKGDFFSWNPLHFGYLHIFKACKHLMQTFCNYPSFIQRVLWSKFNYTAELLCSQDRCWKFHASLMRALQIPTSCLFVPSWRPVCYGFASLQKCCFNFETIMNSFNYTRNNKQIAMCSPPKLNKCKDFCQHKKMFLTI